MLGGARLELSPILVWNGDAGDVVWPVWEGGGCWDLGAAGLGRVVGCWESTGVSAGAGLSAWAPQFLGLLGWEEIHPPCFPTSS